MEGGSIVWRLEANEVDFDRTMQKVRANARRTGAAVDRELKKGTERANKSLREFRTELSRSASFVRNFQVAVRGFNMTSMILGVTVATGVVVELASAVASTGGALLTLPSIISTAVGAFAVIKTATSGMSDAFDALAKGDVEDLAEAMKKLTPAAQDFVKAFGEIKQSFQPIQQAVQEEFFQDLGRQMREVAAVSMPMLQTGMVAVAKSLNGMAQEATYVMKQPFFQGMVASILDTTAKATDTLTGALEPLALTLEGLVRVGTPYTLMLSEWIVNLTKTAAAFTQSEEGQRKMTAAIDLGLDALQQLGELAGAVTGFLVTLFKISNQEGLSFIDTLTDVFNKMNDWLKTSEGQAEMQALLRTTNEVFKEVLEVVGKVAGIILDIVEAFDGLPDPVKKAAIEFLAWTAVLTPIVTYVTALSTSLRLAGAAVSTFLKIIGVSGALSMFGQGFKDARVAASVFSGVFGTLGGVVRTFANFIGGALLSGLKLVGQAFLVLGRAMFLTPIGLIITGIIALVAGFIWLWNNVEGFRNFWIGLWEGIKQAPEAISQWFSGTFVPAMQSIWDGITAGLQAVGDFFVDIWNGVVDFFKGLWDGLVEVVTNVWTSITDAISTAVAAVLEFLQPLFTVFDGIMYVLNAFWTIVSTVFTAIGEIIWTIVSTIVQIIGVVLVGSFNWLMNNVLTPLGAFFVTVFTAIWTTITTVVTAIWTTIVTIFTTIWTFIVTVFTAIWNTITSIATSIWNAITAVFSAIWNTVSSVVSGIWNTITATFTAIWNTIVSVLAGIWNTISSTFSNIWNTISSVVSGIWNTVTSTFNGILNSIRNVVNNVLNAVTTGFNNVKNAIGNAIQGGVQAVTNAVGSFLSAGKNIIDGLVRGISGGSAAVVNKVKEIAAGALNAVKSFFGIKSPSRVMASMGDYMMQGMERGIARTGDSVISAALDVAGGIASAFTTLDGSNYTVGASATFDTLAPIVAAEYNDAEDSTKRFEYNIGEINIGSEVDGESWLKKLTQDQEILSNGLTPQTRYN